MKRFYLPFVWATFTCLTLSIHTKTDRHTSEFDFDEIDELAEQYGHASATHRTPCSVSQVLQFYTDPAFKIVLQERLQEYLYIQTNPINQRSLLDLPDKFSQLFCNSCTEPSFRAWGFYNQYFKMNYTQESTQINSYLALNNANIFQGMHELVSAGFNLPKALELIGHMNLEQRRVGAFGGIFTRKGDWSFEAKMPFYYMEHNFALTPSEKQELLNTALFDDNGNDITENEEVRRHFVADAVGLGDSRLTVGRILIDKPGQFLMMGAEVTLPTAIAFGRGGPNLFGGKFNKNNQHAYINLYELGNSLLCDTGPNAVGLAFKYVEAFADVLSSNLLLQSMGNGGHVGFVFFGEVVADITPSVVVKMRSALEFFLPHDEKRFYIFRKSAADFNRDYTVQTPPVPNINLQFLTDQANDFFYPTAYRTSVTPGFLLKFTNQWFKTAGKNWHVGGGYDIWYQSSEALGTIYGAQDQIELARTDIARKPAAFQFKALGSVTYYYPLRNGCTCNISLYADMTVLQAGIGEDVNISLNCGVTL